MDDKTLNLWRQIAGRSLSGGQASTAMRSHAKLESCRRRDPANGLGQDRPVISGVSGGGGKARGSTAAPG
jgi:hypothetical protein